ncbi:GlxA family transcriptional regulator (plasmid) [Shinella yambaruensis]|uniref:GlxA family transcriptional regulator n=1 Tax=Shinella TaxID=323620 RepID=UPI002586EABA|nr:GlxA family transcriptional regulator [Shinella sp.]MCW5712379.1 GlxA family transcriptional regulator [Shinella sp.]
MFERAIGYVVADRRERPRVQPRPTVALRVGFVLARHFTLSAFSLFVDTLRLASDVDDRSGRLLCDWDVISATPHMIASSCGIKVSPTTRLGNPERYDYIAVIGGLLNVEEQLDRETMAFLHEASRKKTRIIGVCTGSFILAGSGLLHNRQACVSWLHYSEFKARFPEVRLTSQRLFIEDGGIITCAGGSAVADLAALLVRRHVGESAEKNALEILQLERRRDGSEVQSRAPISLPVHFDERIKAALLCMEQNLDERIGIGEIALSVGLSRRQLERIFHDKTGISPAAAYEKIRLKQAMLLIERTSKSLIEIALDVGFASSSHFCRRFRANFGTTPNALRMKSRAPRSLELGPAHS